MTREPSGAAEAARAEAATWVRLAGLGLAAATEAEVVRFHDPGPDLDRRAGAWGHRLSGHHFGELARFAAALAVAEAEAWERDEPHVATKAYEDRRFLVGDRIVHWAVPWLEAEGAGAALVTLLELGDLHRPAPAGGEGAAPPGEDAFGPLALEAPLADRLRSLWSGIVLGRRAATPGLYEHAADRWRSLAAAHPGTAGLWRDLAARATRTAAELRATPPPSR